MKHLTITLISLLILGGCSQEPTELERCIEANTPSLENNIEEKGAKLQEEYYDENGEVVEDWISIFDDFHNNVITDFEKELVKCIDDKMHENVLDPSELNNVDKYNALWKEFMPSCEKSVSSEMVDKARKICHSQGIY